MAKVIMVQGTMSGAGKSLIVAGLCRIFRQDGYRVAPFKSQNMALNSYITKEGLEMGRAQVMQAEAAGIEPSVLMNPVLLKPTSHTGSQVIIQGEVYKNMHATEYFSYKKQLMPMILDAFSQLEKMVDIIVIEGAGSPAEINLRENDIVNMGLAEAVDAPVLLVGDIDRGGVFAQLLGTMMLLSEEEQNRVKGLIVNKFRGDADILAPGIAMLEERVGRSVVGVVPYMDVDIEDEDSLTERFSQKKEGRIHIAVIKYPRISNFTDVAVFEQMDGVSVCYVTKPQELRQADLILLPGSKNTMGDLLWMRENGLEVAIRQASEDTLIFGICGGYQMLGMDICDPNAVEEGGQMDGMQLLPIHTVLGDEKIRAQAHGEIMPLQGELAFLSGKQLLGYEIHMGVTTNDGEATLCELADAQGKKKKADGAYRGNVYGTYLHGFFDAGDIATAMVAHLGEKKGVDFSGQAPIEYRVYKEHQYDLLADTLRSSIDMEAIYEFVFEKTDKG